MRSRAAGTKAGQLAWRMDLPRNSFVDGRRVALRGEYSRFRWFAVRRLPEAASAANTSSCPAPQSSAVSVCPSLQAQFAGRWDITVTNGDDMVSGNIAAITPKEMAAAAPSGEASVGLAIRTAATWLGIGVANVVTALHPELVVLGGL